MCDQKTNILLTGVLGGLQESEKILLNNLISSLIIQ
jgi:hypothetical protein